MREKSRKRKICNDSLCIVCACVCSTTVSHVAAFPWLMAEFYDFEWKHKIRKWMSDGYLNKTWNDLTHTSPTSVVEHPHFTVHLVPAPISHHHLLLLLLMPLPLPLPSSFFHQRMMMTALYNKTALDGKTSRRQRGGDGDGGGSNSGLYTMLHM